MRCMCAQLIQLEIRNANCYALCCCDHFFGVQNDGMAQNGKWKMKMMNCAWKWLHRIKRVIRKIITIRLIANSFQSYNCSRISFDKKPSRSLYFHLRLLHLFFPPQCIDFYCDFSIYFDARTSYCLHWWTFSSCSVSCLSPCNSFSLFIYLFSAFAFPLSAISFG